MIRVGEDVTPPEENADLQIFIPERVHLLLKEVNGDLPHHNDMSHLNVGVAHNTIWKCY